MLATETIRESPCARHYPTLCHGFKRTVTTRPVGTTQVDRQYPQLSSGLSSAQLHAFVQHNNNNNPPSEHSLLLLHFWPLIHSVSRLVQDTTPHQATVSSALSKPAQQAQPVDWQRQLLLHCWPLVTLCD